MSLNSNTAISPSSPCSPFSEHGPTVKASAPGGPIVPTESVSKEALTPVSGMQNVQPPPLSEHVIADMTVCNAIGLAAKQNDVSCTKSDRDAVRKELSSPVKPVITEHAQVPSAEDEYGSTDQLREKYNDLQAELPTFWKKHGHVILMAIGITLCVAGAIFTLGALLVPLIVPALISVGTAVFSFWGGVGGISIGAGLICGSKSEYNNHRREIQFSDQYNVNLPTLREVMGDPAKLEAYNKAANEKITSLLKFYSDRMPTADNWAKWKLNPYVFALINNIDFCRKNANPIEETLWSLSLHKKDFHDIMRSCDDADVRMVNDIRKDIQAKEGSNRPILEVPILEDYGNDYINKRKFISKCLEDINYIRDYRHATQVIDSARGKALGYEFYGAPDPDLYVVNVPNDGRD